MANEAALYGTDIQALDDLNDPEILVSGDLNVAHALGRRLITDADAMLEIGDTAPYDSINLNDWLGRRFQLSDPTVIDDLQQQCRQVLSQDPRVDSVSVNASFSQGQLAVSVQGQGAQGPFKFVLATDGVTASLLRG